MLTYAGGGIGGATSVVGRRPHVSEFQEDAGGGEGGGRETAEREVEAILTLTEHSKAVCALEAAGEYVFSGSFDATIRVWHRYADAC
jgi:hypothetical protein